MAVEIWSEFLGRWNKERLASPPIESSARRIRKTEWLEKPPATPEEIAEAEYRLAIALPPSYRAFLKVSNGWGRTSASIDELWGTAQIDWFRKANRDWIAAYTAPAQWGPREETPPEEYFSYGEHSSDFKPAHLKETLQISAVGDDAVYLLNPQVISRDGEWEAWFFANWLPGALRYRSFAELMEAEYHSFAGIEWKQPSGIRDGLPDEFVGAPGNPKRRIKKRTARREPRVLGKPLHKWSVEELLGFLNNPEYNIIHDEVIEGLAKLGDPRAVEPLLALLKQDAPSTLAAAHALRRLAPNRLKPALLDLLRNDHGRSLNTHGFASLLASMGETDAVPILVEIMLDDRPQSQWFRESGARTIAEFGKPGFDALVGLLSSANLKTKTRAAAGLVDTNTPQARPIFEQLLSDAEPEIREIAEFALKFLPRARFKETRD